MLRKTGLLIVSNPTQIGNILTNVQKQVKNTLYIQLLSSLSEPLGNFYPATFNKWPKFSRLIFNIYSQVASHCNDNLDVKVLLSGIKYNIPKIKTQKPIDLIIFDKSQSSTEIEEFIKTKVENITKEYEVLVLDNNQLEFEPESFVNSKDENIYKHTVIGGTFDRLHLAHKLLLSEVTLRASEKVTVGVTDENMLQSKLLWELIEDMDVRIANVKNFLTDICPEINFEVVPISDPFGPSITDPTMELIVVSQETLKGGHKINEIRTNKNMKPLIIVPIELVDEPNPNPIEEAKISSSTHRIRLLGTPIRCIEVNKNIPKKPYVIGLTGGIASGKSGVASHMENLGALIINCDIVCHNMYKAGEPCHRLIVEHFGDKVVDDKGEINRKVLGEIVFKDPQQLEKLNSIVWPSTNEEVKRIIRSTDKQIVVVDAAVLIKAGWHHQCHEIWSSLVPRAEAIRRLVERNKLTEEQANNRIDSQPPNTFYVKHSHVVFCTLWEVEYTREQVVRAWKLLQNRLL